MDSLGCCSPGRWICAARAVRSLRGDEAEGLIMRLQPWEVARCCKGCCSPGR